MPRYFAELSFKGTRYYGWQIQRGQVSVQEVLERTFSVFLRKPVIFTGAGRTDSGVHAFYFVAHFDLEELPFSTGDMVYKLNRFLPDDISLIQIRKVSQDAHARFSALSRTYRYFITMRKDPFCTETAYFFSTSLDVERMNEAASILLKHSDFTSFSKLHTDVKTNICRIETARWERSGYKLVFTITADRFLRNMVRAIVGTILEVGKGKLTVPQFEEIILKKERCAAGPSAPARGLFLAGIKYPDDLQGDGWPKIPVNLFPGLL